MELIILIAVFIYTIWAFYVGWRIMTGRIAWLEDVGVLNRIVKTITSLAVGYVIGAFYGVFLVFKLAFRSS